MSKLSATSQNFNNRTVDACNNVTYAYRKSKPDSTYTYTPLLKSSVDNTTHNNIFAIQMFNYRKEIDELFAIQFRVDNKVITIYLGGGMYNKLLQNFITFHQFEITGDFLEHVNNILLFQSTKCHKTQEFNFIFLETDNMKKKLRVMRSKSKNLVH